MQVRPRFPVGVDGAEEDRVVPACFFPGIGASRRITIRPPFIGFLSAGKGFPLSAWRGNSMPHQSARHFARSSGWCWFTCAPAWGHILEYHVSMINPLRCRRWYVCNTYILLHAQHSTAHAHELRRGNDPKEVRWPRPNAGGSSRVTNTVSQLSSLLLDSARNILRCAGGVSTSADRSDILLLEGRL